MEEYKLIIAGGRDFSNYNLLRLNLDAILEKLSENNISLTIICGMAKGADMCGWNWAKNNNIPILEYPANWQLHGKAAGPIRNQEMARVADGLIAFWDGTSRGTSHMINTMKELKKDVCVIKYYTYD